MRAFSMPVIAHIKNEKVWLDMRTVTAKEAEQIAKDLNDFFLEHRG